MVGRIDAQREPRNGEQLVAHSEESAERQNGIGHLAGWNIDHDVLELAELFARIFLVNVHDVPTTIAFVHGVTSLAALGHIAPQVDDATARSATLVASLHAVDLALRWFPRIIGLKAGEVVFDLPPVRITDALLRDLYAAETSVPPTQAPEPLALPARGPRHIAAGCKPQ